jgi:hypothetical protein
MDYTEALHLCNFPLRLHPVSELIMYYYNEGRVSTAEFLRFFSLPNSDYIELAACYVNMIMGLAPFS